MGHGELWTAKHGVVLPSVQWEMAHLGWASLWNIMCHRSRLHCPHSLSKNKWINNNKGNQQEKEQESKVEG